MMSISSGAMAKHRKDMITLGACYNSLQRCYRKEEKKNTDRELKSPNSSFSNAISSYMSWGESLRLSLFHPYAYQSLCEVQV